MKTIPEEMTEISEDLRESGQKKAADRLDKLLRRVQNAMRLVENTWDNDDDE